MRLYLSSYRLGDHPDRLRDLAGSGRRAVVIGNALDALSADVRRGVVNREIADLETLGFDAREVDLRRPDAGAVLHAADLIWVSGGNVFVLRRALADSGVERQLVGMIETDGVVYAGYSAGACVLAPDLNGFEHIDDDTLVELRDRAGLAVLDRPVVPHVNSPGHPETHLCDQLSAAFSRDGREHWALRDGDVLLIQDGGAEILGRTRP